MGEIVTLPVFVDGHVHLREPGDNVSETIDTGTEAAIHGGVGAVGDMSNNPGNPTNSVERLKFKHDRIRATANTYVGTAGGIQPEYGNLGQLTQMLPLMWFTKMYGGPTTGVSRTADYEAYEFDEGLDRLAQEAPDKLVVFHSGEDNYRDFIGHAAGDRRLRVDLAHVNKIDQIFAVHEAQLRGWDVQARICPHTMLLTGHDRLTRSSFADMQPPLVSEVDAERLFHAFATERIMLETDHAPHFKPAKWIAIHANPACEVGSDRCCGVPGLEFAAPLMFWQIKLGRLSMERLIDAYSTQPAERLGIHLRPDSVVEWDMEDYRIEDEATQVISGSGWTPYLGMLATGKVRRMSLGGHVVFEDGEIVDPVRRVLMGVGEEI